MNIVRMPLSRWQQNQSLSLYQYDYGQKLLFEDVQLPQVYEVHFSNSKSGESITMVGGPSGVEIPDELLLTGEPIYLWLFLHQGADDGETKYQCVINVIKRPQPTDVEITPVEHDEIANVLAALNGAVGRVENSISYIESMGDTIEDTVNSALQAAYESGMFEGEKGDKGDQGIQGPRGEQGIQGERGPAGSTGSTGNGIRAVEWHDNFTITFYFTNGDRFTTPTLRGPAGPAGNGEGVSPTVTVTEIIGGHQITITDANGEHSFNVYDGAGGGSDGVSPTVSVYEITGGHTVVITDANGEHSFDVMDGTGGSGSSGSSGDLSDKADKEDTVLLSSLSKGRAEDTNVGDGSFAFGSEVTASGSNSFAIGSLTKASGMYSVAEGSHTTASGALSHSQGRQTTAGGVASHAEGVGTTAGGSFSHVSGAFNVEDSYINWDEWVSGTSYAVGAKVKRTVEADEVITVTGYICVTPNDDVTFDPENWEDLEGKMNYAEIVGNGTSDSDKSNARTLDWDGNSWYKGNVTAAGGSLTLGSGNNAVTITASQLQQLIALIT